MNYHNIILGETCLLSYQLKRLGIHQSENNLFDNMLTNIDGVYAFVEDNFEGVLDDRYLLYSNFAYYPAHNISYSKWINTRYSIDEDNIFSWPVFSFFHYDALNGEQRDSIIRKTARIKEKFEDTVSVNLFYYYRQSERFNLDKLIEKCAHFLAYLRSRYNKEFNFFLIHKDDNSKNITHNVAYDVHSFLFSSPHSWIGIDDNWNGLSDDDLFDKFAEHYKEIIKK